MVAAGQPPTPARATCGAPGADAWAGAWAVGGGGAAESGPAVDGLQALDHQGGGDHEDDGGGHSHEVVVTTDQLEVLGPRDEEQGDLGHLHAVTTCDTSTNKVNVFLEQSTKNVRRNRWF